MIVEFRVLAVSKEKNHYETDLLRGIFGIEHNMLDTVDHLPPQTAINLIDTNNWKPTVTEVIDLGDYIVVPFVKQS